MDIDISLLRTLETEHEIPLDQLIETIEQALLLAYHRSPGAIAKARAEIDKKSGKVTIWAVEYGDDDEPIGEFDDTPSGFDRIAASTARQVIVQRLRDAEDNQVLGEFRDKQDQIISGVIQQGSNPHMIQVDLGSVEGVLPPAEQVPVKTTPTGHGFGPTWSRSDAVLRAHQLPCHVPTLVWFANSLNLKSLKLLMAQWKFPLSHVKPVTGPRSR